jgi:hypothetical protein
MLYVHDIDSYMYIPKLSSTRMRYASSAKTEVRPISSTHHLQTRLLPTQLLSSDNPKVLVQSITRSLTLLQPDNHTNIPIRPNNHNASLLLIEPHLRMRCRLGVRNPLIPHIIRIHVIRVACKRLGQLLVNVNLTSRVVEDKREREERCMRVMMFVITICFLEIGVEEGGEERCGVCHVRSEVFKGGAGLFNRAAEDEDTVGAVEGDFLLEVHDVSVNDACDGRWRHDAAGTLGCAVFVREVERVLGGVLGAPIDGVGVVGYAVAGGEFAGCFEGLDEFVFFNGRVGSRACDFAGGGDACGEEFGVAGVEVEERFGDQLTFGFVGLEDVACGPATFDVVDLPGEIYGVEEGGVHALSCLRRMCVASISSHEDSLIQSVSLCNTLTDGVDRIPLYPVPSDCVWLKNCLREFLGVLCGDLLAWVPIFVCRARDLDVEANHVVFTGNDHDTTGV